MAKKKEAPARPRGRPRSPLEAKHQVRMSTDEKEEWSALAEALGMDLSAWLRMAGHKEARRQRER